MADRKDLKVRKGHTSRTYPTIENPRASADFDVLWFRQEPYSHSREGSRAREMPPRAHKVLYI